MKKLYKIYILLGILSILSFTGTNASAADKKYSIENAEFNVFLSENGTAFVTEKWDLNFEKGDFTRFYVNRLTNTNELENYDSIDLFNFKINGLQCIQTDDTQNRPQRTYSIENKGDHTEYAWYFRAHNQKLSLECSYYLNNVVKYNDIGYAFFSYRFIPIDFSTDINKLNIKIIAPKDCLMEVRNDSNMNYNIYDDYVKLNSRDNSGLVKINVAMDKSAFSNNISYINQDTLDEITSEDDDTFEILITLLIVAMLLILSIYKVLYICKRNKLAKDKDYICNVVNKLKTNDITPLEFSRMMHIERISVNEFKLVFLDLLRKDLLRIQENNIYFDSSINNSLKSYEINLINALLKYANQDNNSSYISMDDLFTYLKRL